MQKENVSAAWKGQPIPDGLKSEERAQYIMLREMYEDFKTGRLTEKQGARIKNKIMLYQTLSVDQKAMLLEYYIPLLAIDILALKILSHEYYSVTGGLRPYVKNTILE